MAHSLYLPTYLLACFTYLLTCLLAYSPTRVPRCAWTCAPCPRAMLASSRARTRLLATTPGVAPDTCPALTLTMNPTLTLTSTLGLTRFNPSTNPNPTPESQPQPQPQPERKSAIATHNPTAFTRFRASEIEFSSHPSFPRPLPAGGAKRQREGEE